MVVLLKNNFYKIKPVITPKDIQNGMMNKTFGDGFDGMLFIMNNDNHSFWMKNCIISLDIIFIEDNKITKIHSNCKPCIDDNCKSYKGYGNLILEIPGGDCEKYGITIGDTIKFI